MSIMSEPDRVDIIQSVATCSVENLTINLTQH
jgi:hypothetical protein